jgi:hypothetical protein
LFLAILVAVKASGTCFFRRSVLEGKDLADVASTFHMSFAMIGLAGVASYVKGGIRRPDIFIRLRGFALVRS